MSQEMLRLVEAFGYGWSDLERFTINAMKSAFIHFDERLAIIDEVIKPRLRGADRLTRAGPQRKYVRRGPHAADAYAFRWHAFTH